MRRIPRLPVERSPAWIEASSIPGTPYACRRYLFLASDAPIRHNGPQRISPDKTATNERCRPLRAGRSVAGAAAVIRTTAVHAIKPIFRICYGGSGCRRQ